MDTHRRRYERALAWCLVALAVVAHRRDMASAASRSAAERSHAPEETSSYTREVAAPNSLPEGGYLPHRSPPELDHKTCLASVAKEPVRGRLDRAVVLAAMEQLNLPMGVGRLLVVRGQPYLFCLEPHYHAPGSGVGPEGWHKGVTVYRGSLGDTRLL